MIEDEYLFCLGFFSFVSLANHQKLWPLKARQLKLIFWI